MVFTKKKVFPMLNKFIIVYVVISNDWCIKVSLVLCLKDLSWLCGIVINRKKTNDINGLFTRK
jgi:hypothetical protein